MRLSLIAWVSVVALGTLPAAALDAPRWADASGEVSLDVSGQGYRVMDSAGHPNLYPAGRVLYAVSENGAGFCALDEEVNANPPLNRERMNAAMQGMLQRAQQASVDGGAPPSLVEVDGVLVLDAPIANEHFVGMRRMFATYREGAVHGYTLQCAGQRNAPGSIETAQAVASSLRLSPQEH